jgi:hypothetical protein
MHQSCTAVGKRFLFESSVMDGVPVFSFLRAMPAARVRCDAMRAAAHSCLLHTLHCSVCSMGHSMYTCMRRILPSTCIQCLQCTYRVQLQSSWVCTAVWVL